MDPERARIQADLRGLIEGEVFCDDLYLQMYSTDASILQIMPLALVRPRSRADVVACVKYAADNHLPLHPRGSGSNVVGGAIGPGIVIDFSCHMNRITPSTGNSVHVQPGVILATLNRFLEKRGQIFGPDPATRSVTTLGGVLAMNSIGSHWMKYGSPRDRIEKLEVVLADGNVIEVGPQAHPQGVANQLSAAVDHIVGRRQELLQQHRPNTLINHAGYQLDDIMVDGHLDLSRLFVGSEGTLGLITSATMRTSPLPQHRGVILLFFDQMQRAATVALDLIKRDVVACDLMDRRLLSIAGKSDRSIARLIPDAAEAMLLVEMEAEDETSLRSKISSLADRMTRRKRLAFDARTTCEREQRNLYWRMVRRIIPMQSSLKSERQAIPFVEDIAIAPELLPSFIGDLHGILNRLEITASVFAHVAQGLIHVRPQLDLTNPEDIKKIPLLSDELFSRVIECKGTISGGHGDGLVRTPYLRRQYGRAYEAFVEVKRTFDPLELLNPGKIIGPPSADVLTKLRKQQVDETLKGLPTEADAAPTAKKKSKSRNGKLEGLPIIQPQLHWDLDQLADAATDCNGCARCRTSSSNERMCPIFRIARREEASPRAKANLARDLVTGQLDPSLLNKDSLKEIADLCTNCHQCRLECPAQVDIPKLMMETKAQYYAVNGLKMSDWLLTRLDLLYRWAARTPRITNWMIRQPFMRWMMERFLGIAQARKLPRFASRPFTRWAQRRRLTQVDRRPGKKVLYFVDAFANWNDPELARATCAVLKHNGFEVFVPPTQQVSGMSLISAGVIDPAKKIATKNVELLAEGVRQGCQVVTTEPSAALALTHEYLHLLDDDDAKLVAENTLDISNFLWNLHQTGDLELNFRPLNVTVGYHLPCHQKALGPAVAAQNLLNLIPGIQVERIEKGCSGMAGTYGLIRSNYRRSLRVGMGLISAIRRPDIMVGATECSTCKIQMEQGTVKPTIHPVKIIAMAYALMPELDNLFNRRSGDLVTS